MTSRASENRKPTTDERPLWDVIKGTLAYRAMCVAHDLKFFALLADSPRTLDELCRSLQVEHRPARSILAACAAMGLVKIENGQYSLTQLAQDYLVQSSPYYFGGFLDMLVANDAVLSFESLKKAVLTNKAQVYGGEELWISHEEQAALARAFTRGMHGHSAGASTAWPEIVDLSNCHRMLDVGGGSGIHSISATLRWPDLEAIVFDIPPVCEVAEETARSYGLSDRIKTQAGDMWNDPFPQADIHFYADIYHDWSPEKCQFLTKKSFDSLGSNGRIIIHEILYNDEKTGPLMAAAYGVAMLLWTEGQQFSGRELTAMLREAGFVDIEAKPTFGYWSIVTGRKP